MYDLEFSSVSSSIVRLIKILIRQSQTRSVHRAVFWNHEILEPWHLSLVVIGGFPVVQLAKSYQGHLTFMGRVPFQEKSLLSLSAVDCFCGGRSPELKGGQIRGFYSFKFSFARFRSQ